MGCVGRFVLSLKGHGDVPGDSPQCLTGGIEYSPLGFHVAWFRKICASPFHYCLHQVSRCPCFDRGSGSSRNDYKLIIHAVLVGSPSDFAASVRLESPGPSLLSGVSYITCIKHSPREGKIGAFAKLAGASFKYSLVIDSGLSDSA